MTTTTKQVVVVGAGPAGTLLGLILQASGVDVTVLERKSRDYVLNRIRAGVLESTSVDVLKHAGLGDRLTREGHVHETVKFAWGGTSEIEVEFQRLAGKPMIAYGQTKIQEDLYGAAKEFELDIVFEATDVEIHDHTSDHPYVTYVANGDTQRINCRHIAACDGQHGVGQTAIPDHIKSEHLRSYPFGWLGILSETPPLPTLVYANHEQGFALCSERNPMLSRYYVQCDADDNLDDWSDDRFWSELLGRLPSHIADQIVTGPSIEKSIAPLRSRVIEPMQYGNLFLAGDAAHIVPPTGAKGLNLAISDVHYLSQALIAAHTKGDGSLLADYSTTALSRVWSSVRFSWWLTVLLHRFPSQTSFEQRMREEDLNYLARSEAAQQSLAEQYVGLDL